MTPIRVMQALWLAWWVSWMAAGAWSDRATHRPPFWRQIDYRVLAAIGAILLFGGYRHRLSSEVILWRLPDAALWAMLTLVIAGFAFTWWARVHLGRLWSSSVTRKADHRVIDTGPYGLVRHPIYTGIILASSATAAMRGTALAWVGVAVMTLGWYVKARLEERFLREQLGVEAYSAYASRVPMLIPFLR